jgi:hypothetical protein
VRASQALLPVPQTGFKGPPKHFLSWYEKEVAAKWPKLPSSRSFEPVWLSQKGGALTTSAIGQTCPWCHQCMY